MSEVIEKRLHELREQARVYAQAEAQRTYLEHYRQSKLAILMKHYAGAGIRAVTAQEREARADPAYIELLEGLKEATEIAERERWLLQIAMRGSSLWQSEQARLREELRAYGVKEA